MSPRESIQTEKRTSNRDRILRELHFRGPARRTELGRRLGIRPNSITSIIDELLAQGYIRSCGEGVRSPVELSGSKHVCLCGHLTQSTFRLHAVSLSGELEELGKHSIASCKSAEEICVLVEQTMLQGLRSLESGARKILGAGLGLPGLVDPRLGLALYASNLPEWKDIPLRERLEKTLGQRVVIENDTRCQLYARGWYGRLQEEYRNMILIGLSEGVGGALMVSGEVLLGHNFSAGELGHVRAGNQNRPCSCGRLDCLETYCGFAAIRHELQMARPDLHLESAAEIARLVREERVLSNIITRMGETLAEAVLPLAIAFDPEAIILSAFDESLAALFLPALTHRLGHAFSGAESRAPKIVQAPPAAVDVPLGISALLIQEAFRTPGLTENSGLV